jgi:hypothetical protein
MPEQEYDHVRVSVTEQLRDIQHCPDIATMKYLSSQFINSGIRDYQDQQLVDPCTKTTDKRSGKQNHKLAA